MRRILLGCVILLALSFFAQSANALVCGDINGDTKVDISDMVYLVNYMILNGPAPVSAYDANVDLCDNVDIGDLTYLSYYFFGGGYPPCYGGINCTSQPGGMIVVDHVDGLAGPNILATGVPITFYLRYINTTGYTVHGLANGFSIRSPEGATWNTASIDTLPATIFSGTPIHVFNHGWSTNGAGTDTIRTLVEDFRIGAGYGVAPGANDIVYKITIGPLSVSDEGKSIVLDSVTYSNGGVWKWSSSGTATFIPAWGGPYRYYIGYRPSSPAHIAVGTVHGDLGGGLIPVNTTVTFDLVYQDSLSYPFHVLSNGIKIFSPDGATWTESHGIDNGVFTTDMFESGVFVNNVNTDGAGTDTIGFGALTVSSQSGMPAGFVGSPFSVAIGPISSQDIGKTICLDSSWYPPINNWIWGSLGMQDIFPDWYGPYCYLISDTSALTPTLAPMPDTLYFSCYEGGSPPSYNYFRVEETHNIIIPYSITNATPWVTLDHDAGTTPDSIFVTLDVSGLGVGLHTASLMVSSDSAFNSPQWVHLRLYILPVPSRGIVLDYVNGGVGANQIRIDTTVSFDFRVMNNGSDTIQGLVNGFRVYGPDGPQWGATTGDTIGLISRDLFRLVGVINYFSNDGSGADSLIFGFAGLGSPDGLPPGFDDVSYRISVGPISASQLGKTLCVDSSWTPPTGNWLWSTGHSNFAPSWGGPYCFTIVDAPGFPVAPPPPPPPPSSGDSLLLPPVVVAPGGGVQPVMVQLNQPIKGVTVPLKIPAGVSVSGITFDSLITEGWDYAFTQIKPDSGFLFVALANSFGARIPNGTNEIFRVHFSASNPSCADYRTIRWDTTLMGQVSRQLTFADTLAHPVYPGFSYLRDSLLVMPFVPGDCSADNAQDIGDIVCLVDYMFNGSEPPININAVDNNGDCVGPDIADLVYLVDFQFVGGPAPVCGCVVGAKKVSPLRADITVGSAYDKDGTIIVLTSPVDIRGIELTLEGAANTTPAKLVGDGLDLLSGNTDGGLRAGILDLNGSNTIAAGTTQLLRLPGTYRISSAVVAIDGSHSVVPVISDKTVKLPETFELYQNYPNPFNPSTEIGFALPQAAQVRLEIFNIMGQRVKLLADQYLEAGVHTFLWDGRDATGNTVASGVYLYRLDAGAFTASRKMLLLK